MSQKWNCRKLFFYDPILWSITRRNTIKRTSSWSTILVGIADTIIISDGLINHWVPNRDSLSPPHRFRQNSQYEMIDNGSTIRIKQDGMYLIYAQVWHVLLCFRTWHQHPNLIVKKQQKWATNRMNNEFLLITIWHVIR
jgi:hypothetical protein